MRRREHTAPLSLFSFQDIITSVTGIIITITLILALELVESLTERQSTETPAIVRQVRTALEEARQQVEALRSQVRTEGGRVARWAALSPHQLERETFDTTLQIDGLEDEVQILKQHERQLEKDLAESEDSWSRQDSQRAALRELREQAKVARNEVEALKSTNRSIYNPSDYAGRTVWVMEVSQDRLSIAPGGRKAKPTDFTSADGGQIQEFAAWLDGRNPEADAFLMLIRPSGIDGYRSLFDKFREGRFSFGVDLIAEDQTVIDPETGAGF